MLQVRCRRSGRVYRFPAMYAEDADSIWVFPGGAEHKTWWRNLTDPASVTSDDNMLFADDTTTYWSRLSVDQATTAGGSATGEPTQALIKSSSRYIDGQRVGRALQSWNLGTGYLNNTGDRVRFTDPSGAEDDRYSCSTTQYDTVFHRIGDEGAWCDAIKRTANPATFA